MKSRPAPSSRLESGQGLAEYLIIVVIIAVAVILGVRYFGSSVTEQFHNATGQLDDLAGKEASTTEGASDGRDKAGAEKPAIDSKPPADRITARAKNDPLKDVGVGTEKNNVVDGIELDWKTLGVIFGVACLFGVALLFRMLKRDPKKKKQKKDKKRKRFSLSRGKSEGGQAMVEFVLIAITFFFSILGILQVAMIMNAYTLVRYAAYNAARAAIVHGGDLEKTHEAARLSLLAIFPSHGRADNILGMVQNYAGAAATDKNPLMASYAFSIMPYFDQITEVKILPGHGRNSGDVVTFDDPQDSEKGLITVEVTHRYEMVVPLVNRIFFYVYNLFRDKKSLGPILASGYQNQTLDNLSAETNRRRRAGDLYASAETRIPLTAHYTMRMQSDYVVP